MFMGWAMLFMVRFCITEPWECLRPLEAMPSTSTDFAVKLVVDERGIDLVMHKGKRVPPEVILKLLIKRKATILKYSTLA